jgi:SAM-dependent methyltransferase
MADRHYDDPQLPELYDWFEGDRRDLEVFAALVDELGGHSVLDVGCGTGTLCCMLAERGKQIAGIDPAAAELLVARAKPQAHRIRWLNGGGADIPPLDVDIVTMTGNVAQVFLSDADWHTTLDAAHDALRPGGWLIFETRNRARQAWREWTPEHSYKCIEVPGVGAVSSWVDVTEVSEQYVSFRSVFCFEGRRHSKDQRINPTLPRTPGDRR